MASSPSPPPILPISSTQTPQTTTLIPNSQDTLPTATSNSAFRVFLSRFSESARLALSQRRPWPELLDRSAIARPSSLSEATSRLRKNAPYFRINYLILIVSTVALSLFFHPGSLLLLLLLSSAWLFLFLFRPADAPPISFLGRTFSDREILGGLVAVSFVVVFLTNVGSLVVSALMLGIAVVAAHGACHVPDDLFLDEQESGPAVGFLSFLGGSVPSTAVPAVVPARI